MAKWRPLAIVSMYISGVKVRIDGRIINLQQAQKRSIPCINVLQTRRRTLYA